MPVQENEKRKTSVIPEEEKEKKPKAQHLLPFLKAKAESHQHKLDSLDEKIASKEDKIAMCEARIDRLQAKAERLEDISKTLKSLGNLPFARKLIERNKAKITAIREEKIPKQKDKIKASKEKLSKLQIKRDRTEHKLNRIIALNDVIKSFSLGFSPKRREVFAEAMDRLNEASVNCLADKKVSLIIKKEDIIREYNAPDTSVTDKLGLQKRIDEINESIGKLEDKITSIALPENYFEDEADEELDDQITAVEETIGEASEKDELSVPVLTEAVFDTAYEALEQTTSKQEQNKPKEHPQTVNPEYYKQLPKAERFTKFETKETARAIVQGLMKEQIPYSAVVRKNGTVGITVSKSNAKAFRRIESAVKNERAVSLVNPGFFKSLPKQERFTQRMTEEQAKAKIAELGNKGISHSAVLNGDKSAVTVAKNDKAAFFTRSKLKREAARVSGQNRSEKPKQTHKKGQGLE